MTDKLKFQDLNKESQEKVLNNFLPFYLALYNQSDLDVMTTFDRTGIINDLNTFLFNIPYDDKKDIINDALNEQHDEYATLLSKMPQTYDKDGNPTVDWPTWYDSQTTQLAKDSSVE